MSKQVLIYVTIYTRATIKIKKSLGLSFCKSKVINNCRINLTQNLKLFWVNKTSRLSILSINLKYDYFIKAYPLSLNTLTFSIAPKPPKTLCINSSTIYQYNKTDFWRNISHIS